MASKTKWYHVEIKRKSAKVPTRAFPLGWEQGDPFLEFAEGRHLTDSQIKEEIVKFFGSALPCKIHGKGYCFDIN